MRKVAFAHIEKVIDFSTLKEAEEFLAEARHNGWNIEENHKGEKISHTKWDDGSYVEFGYKKVSEFWTIVVRMPYRNYNPGW